MNSEEPVKKEVSNPPSLVELEKAVRENNVFDFCVQHREHVRRASDGKLYLFTAQGMRRFDGFLKGKQAA